jgi:hypothetical protein
MRELIQKSIIVSFYISNALGIGDVVDYPD